MHEMLSSYICCPFCKHDITFDNGNLFCAQCQKIRGRWEDGIVHTEIAATTPDARLSHSKWGALYQKQLASEANLKEQEHYRDHYFSNEYEQLSGVAPLGEGSVFLEIGCGTMCLGWELSKFVELVIGIDISIEALCAARNKFESAGIHNYLLIQGDVLTMPIKNNKIDAIYGGGVIEHFQNTPLCLNELYRVLRTGGISFNTVPYLNLGSLYRQIWGNIPNIKGIRWLFEFFHTRILRGKHLVFGYELSFLATTLKKLHRQAGFIDIKIDRFQVELAFDFIPKRLRPVCVWLATHNRLFWPMVKVVARK